MIFLLDSRPLTLPQLLLEMPPLWGSPVYSATLLLYSQPCKYGRKWVFIGFILFFIVFLFSLGRIRPYVNSYYILLNSCTRSWRMDQSTKCIELLCAMSLWFNWYLSVCIVFDLNRFIIMWQPVYIVCINIHFFMNCTSYYNCIGYTLTHDYVFVC